jgi:conjugal transfer pilus assembly protein TraW
MWPFIAFALSGVFTVTAFAAEQIGPVHRIVEPDMLQEIQRVLKEKEKSGELAKLQKEGIARSLRSIENPPAVEGLTRVEKSRTFYWDPSIRATKTIRDTQGNVVVEEGKTVNPLDVVSLPKHLLFFDGSDQAQVTKAAAIIRHYEGRVNPILVAGPVADLSRKWKSQVYFDQGGSLVRKLGITRVPSLVTQEGNKLRIDELEIK